MTFLCHTTMIEGKDLDFKPGHRVPNGRFEPQASSNGGGFRRESVGLGESHNAVPGEKRQPTMG
jgi:hypothetical protein